MRRVSERLSHLVGSQVERSEAVPGQPGGAQAFDHQGADVGLVPWWQSRGKKCFHSAADLLDCE